jgi:peptidoglycan/LPS O-acetylase OafA/YrhL
MASKQTFIEKFRRVTASGQYLPEIDGLRFIAIASVVFGMHLTTYYYQQIAHLEPKTDTIFFKVLYEGGYGVSLFFMISGFILALPFAKQYFLQQTKVSLRQYFLRRLTRIEPAYIVSLVLYFLLRLWILPSEQFQQAAPHFLASLFYVHGLIYDAHSTINGVAWTLEVEVQFYLLAPLLCTLFLMKNVYVRRVLLGALIITGAIYSYQQQYEVGNILNKGCYFLTGMLLADCFINSKRTYDAVCFTFVGLACFITAMFIPAYYVHVYFCLLKIGLTAIFFFFAIQNRLLKKGLSVRPIAIIGGMCYSIYLMHTGVLGLMGYWIAPIQFVSIKWLNEVLHLLIAVILIMGVSSIFYRLIEKPTMYRSWYKRKKKIEQ